MWPLQTAPAAHDSLLAMLSSPSAAINPKVHQLKTYEVTQPSPKVCFSLLCRFVAHSSVALLDRYDRLPLRQWASRRSSKAISPTPSHSHSGSKFELLAPMRSHSDACFCSALGKDLELVLTKNEKLIPASYSETRMSRDGAGSSPRFSREFAAH